MITIAVVGSDRCWRQFCRIIMPEGIQPKLNEVILQPDTKLYHVNSIERAIGMEFNSMMLLYPDDYWNSKDESLVEYTRDRIRITTKTKGELK